jgi:hypothetical protein
VSDATDADAPEELQIHGNELHSATIPNQGRIDGDGLNTAPTPGQGGTNERRLPQTNQIEADDPDATSTVVVDRFPSGSPGAPIPGMPCGISWRDTSMESMWTPFRSQKDWEIAHWAKTRGSSASDVNHLLAISDVRTFFLSNYCL